MSDLESLAIISGGVLLFALALLLIFYIVNAIGLYKIFTKAGKKGWAGFVPYYNDWVLVEISGCHWWYFLILIANVVLTFFTGSSDSGVWALIINIFSLISFYVALCINYNISKKFHQGIGFAIGMCFFPFIFNLILGFSKNIEYDSSVQVSLWGLYDFGKKTNISKESYCSECGSIITGNFCPKCGIKKGE